MRGAAAARGEQPPRLTHTTLTTTRATALCFNVIWLVGGTCGLNIGVISALDVQLESRGEGGGQAEHINGSG